MYLWSWTYFLCFILVCFLLILFTNYSLNREEKILVITGNDTDHTHQIIHTILRNRKMRLSDISVLFTSWKARINKQLINGILCKRDIKWIFDESLNCLIRDMLWYYRMTDIFDMFLNFFFGGVAEMKPSILLVDDMSNIKDGNIRRL